jgi:hypothetical protein
MYFQIKLDTEACWTSLYKRDADHRIWGRHSLVPRRDSMRVEFMILNILPDHATFAINACRSLVRIA